MRRTRSEEGRLLSRVITSYVFINKNAIEFLQFVTRF